MRMTDLLSLGELLIDFTPAGVSENGNPVFERNPGGGPANVACAAARLGAKAAFIGQVGDDPFGRALRDTLRQEKVDVSRLRLSDMYQTTLAFVHLDESGDRSFSFYRRQGADTMLRTEPADFKAVEQSRVFFFSSVMMTESPARETSFALAAHAKERGVVTVFDPNLRLNLWAGEAEARDCILRAMPFADIVKVSEEELVFLTGETELRRGAAVLYARFPMKALLCTLGAKGVLALAGDEIIARDGLPVKTVDTTAAGDSFTGGFITRLLEEGTDIASLSRETLTRILDFANTVGALTTTRKGAICALPTRDEVEAQLASNQ